MTLTSEQLERELWFRQLRSAIVINADDVDLWAAVYPEVKGATLWLPPLEAARAAALHVRRVLPYQFTGRERILDLAAARVRGFGACGDATAAVAAAVLMADGECDVCYQRFRCEDGSEPVPGYAHVRVVVDGTAVDAYPDEALDLDTCDGRVRITAERVQWPVTAAARALSRLEGKRLPAGPPSGDPAA